VLSHSRLFAFRTLTYRAFFLLNRNTTAKHDCNASIAVSCFGAQGPGRSMSTPKEWRPRATVTDPKRTLRIAPRHLRANAGCEGGLLP